MCLVHNSGAKIKDLKNTVKSKLDTFDVVALYWDSDASDTDEQNLHRDQLRLLRTNYTSHVENVISMVKNAGKRIIIIGPTCKFTIFSLSFKAF